MTRRSTGLDDIPIGLVGLAMTLAIVTAACGASPSSEAPQDSMQVVLQSEPSSLNPPVTIFSDSRAWSAIFDPLVGRDSTTSEPTDEGLLTDWEQESPTEWVFDVRDGVTFHNGEAFNAESAAFTVAEYRDNPQSIFAGYFDVIADVAAEDGQVRITTTRPYSALPYLLTVSFALPPKYYQEVGAEDFGQSPVGTGPYQFEKLDLGQRFQVVRYDDYWRGKPNLNSIVYSWNSEASTRYALLASGDADFVYDIQAQDIARTEQSSDLTVVTDPSVYGMNLKLNAVNGGPLTDVRLREAIALAIDRENLVEAVYQGVGAEPDYAFVGDLLEEPFEVEINTDRDRARQLVEEVGGSPQIVFGYTSGRYPQDSRLGEAVAAMLKSVGFKVDQRAAEYGTYREQRNNGTYDVFMQEDGATFKHPDAYMSYYFGEDASVQFCVDPKDYDKLSAKALSTDDAAEAYQRAERQMTAVDFCVVPLTSTVYSYAMSDTVEGFDSGPLDASPDYFTFDMGSD